MGNLNYLVSKKCVGVIFFLVLVICTQDFATCEEEVTAAAPFGTSGCKNLIMKIAKQQLRAFAACAKEMKKVMDPEELQRRFQCIVKCTMQKEGLLDENSRVSTETLQTFFDKYLPQEFHEATHEMIKGCLEEHAPKMDNGDELCSAYGEFVSCVQDFVGEMCS